MSEKPTIFSFFSGAGFLDLGFELNGYHIAYVNEVFLPFLEAYRYSRINLKLPEVKYGYENCSIEDCLQPNKQAKLKDLLKDTRKSSSIVGFIGGPPCPDFSVGGKNRGHEGDNGRLSEIFVEIICQQKPDFFLFENVKGLWQTKKHRQFYEYLKDKIYRSGYIITEHLINAIEYGVPQDRDRIIMIGFLSDRFSMSINQNKTYELKFPWDDYKSYSRQDVFNLSWPKVHDFKEDSYLDCPNNILQELSVEYWFRKNDVLNHPNAKHHFMPRSGITRFEVIQEGDDSRKSFKRLHRWRYSPTVCYGNNEVHLHPYKIRRISVAEALALQSLPKEYLFPQNMTLTNMFKAIGNGVPYLAGSAIAQSILVFLNSLQHDQSDMTLKLRDTTEYKQLQLELALDF
ncbi:DNA cytosine methyltransferase [uncultured Nostoc sp.]|uniref:DNA cytosine methyltransferase n=1 Tax=uncultured Nostoc sp. TaxID=340711 RepID=UPI0035C982BE